MSCTNEAVATAVRMLRQCSAEMEEQGLWHWACAVQNGAPLPLAVSLGEGFLHLSGEAKDFECGACELEEMLSGNCTLSGGVKFALDENGRGVRLRTDVVLADGARMLDRIQWALCGFHEGGERLRSRDFGWRNGQASKSGNVSLGDLLRQASWPCTERGTNEFTAALEADAAPPARISLNGDGLAFAVELASRGAAPDVVRQAVTVYLLTASSALRLVRAYGRKEEDRLNFGFQVWLPFHSAEEEIDHALAALSVAYRMCAREANVLFDEAAARCYLGTRNLPTARNNQKENCP